MVYIPGCNLHTHFEYTFHFHSRYLPVFRFGMVSTQSLFFYTTLWASTVSAQNVVVAQIVRNIVNGFVGAKTDSSISNSQASAEIQAIVDIVTQNPNVDKLLQQALPAALMGLNSDNFPSLLSEAGKTLDALETSPDYQSLVDGFSKAMPHYDPSQALENIQVNLDNALGMLTPVLPSLTPQYSREWASATSRVSSLGVVFGFIEGSASEASTSAATSVTTTADASTSAATSVTTTADASTSAATSVTTTADASTSAATSVTTTADVSTSARSATTTSEASISADNSVGTTSEASTSTDTSIANTSETSTSTDTSITEISSPVSSITDSSASSPVSSITDSSTSSTVSTIRTDAPTSLTQSYDSATPTESSTLFSFATFSTSSALSTISTTSSTSRVSTSAPPFSNTTTSFSGIHNTTTHTQTRSGTATNHTLTATPTSTNPSIPINAGTHVKAGFGVIALAVGALLL
ncbi:hypothetical protein LXG23DRAFT_46499 [Yarrowia lipolytica]|uniref:Uncharacterized protein n=1 Tax=Yarrowia lipolytica TaxID=4952 RepID=A0A1D8NJ11_YARLL|nr:hypothetical protein YALI1_E22383g [Yarrowia lipolytica]KAJ8057091.1 hypothetical protein LXG23DRAFT_46499 [Yarrowia lipolytica]RMI96487.1 hypothetical protein BD777DRAFT_162500 [Yarrowia lipolytica]